METLPPWSSCARLPELKIRVVNVIDVLRAVHEEHPHGFTDASFTRCSRATGVIFAYHGYPYLIHRLTYKRSNHQNIHVHGFREEGTTTTPFDMVVLNRLDRFHLALNAISRLPRLGEARVSELTASLEAKLDEHAVHIREHGEDMPEIQRWTWMYGTAAEAGD